MLQGAGFPTEGGGQLFREASPVQIGRTGEDLTDCLDKEPDAV